MGIEAMDICLNQQYRYNFVYRANIKVNVAEEIRSDTFMIDIGPFAEYCFKKAWIGVLEGMTQDFIPNDYEKDMKCGKQVNRKFFESKFVCGDCTKQLSH